MPGDVEVRERRASEPTRTLTRVLRPATTADLALVHKLDEQAMPERSFNRQRAAPGELERAIAAGAVSVLELAGRPVGYIQTERRTPDPAGRPTGHEIAGIALLPKHQGHGLGAFMVESCLADLATVRATEPIIAVTSPNNRQMLPILFARGFVARWALPDYHGEGRHRFGCQLRVKDVPRPAGEVERAKIGRALESMRKRDLVVRELSDKGRFRLTQQVRGEFLDCVPPRPPGHAGDEVSPPS